MASIKFSGLPAGSTPTSYAGLVAISKVAAPFDSEKFTLQQLQEIILENTNGRRIIYDSSSVTNIMSDTNSDVQVDLTPGDQGYKITNDGLGTLTKSFVALEAGFLDAGVGDLALGATLTEISLYDNTGGGAQIVVYDVSAQANTTSNFDKNSGVLFSRNSTIPQNRTNSVILAGIGVTADKDDYAFAQNLEVQGGTLDLVQATENTSFVDAGSVSATEQDWIEVTVGGNTGFIRVFAAK